MKRKIKQISAVIALAAFVLFTVFGTVGLVISVSHSCMGMHCRTCEHITVVQQAVSILKAAIVVIAALLFVHETLRLLAAKMPPQFIFFTTVSLKIKLNS
ncbi:MAG: hypothetical protein IJJ41_01425 [Clostridia bacterium]|nr:hypothetical protein [Clostridia bacterium]